MRRLSFIVFFSVLSLGVVTQTVSAAADPSVVLTPERWVISTQDEFSVNIMVDPGDHDIRTVKIELDYPAALIEFVDFELADQWYSVVQAGFDRHDRQTGHILKSGGFPGGIDHEILFGKVTFRGDVPGVGLIQVGGGTALLDEYSDNVFMRNANQTAVRVYDPTTMTEEEVYQIKQEKSGQGDHLFDVIINPDQEVQRNGVSAGVLAFMGSVLFLAFVSAWYIWDRRRG